MKEKADLSKYPQLSKGKAQAEGERWELITEHQYTLRAKTRGTTRPQELYLVAGKAWSRIHSIEKEALDQIIALNVTIPTGSKITFEQWEKTHFGNEYTHIHLLALQTP